MIAAFEANGHFKTYLYEKDPSFTANCNILIALLAKRDWLQQYSSHIKPILQFLCDTWWQADGFVIDKWVSSGSCTVFLVPILTFTRI